MNSLIHQPGITHSWMNSEGEKRVCVFGLEREKERGVAEADTEEGSPAVLRAPDSPHVFYNCICF